MLGLLLKHWKSILDIILVIALVLLLFIWNPLGIFGGGLQLRPTANLVTEIKEMGQLITSEYYGEVIASMEEARMNYLEEDAITDNVNHLYDGIYEAMKYLHDFQNLTMEAKEAHYEEMGLSSGRRRLLRREVTRSNILDKLNDQDLLEDLSYDPLYGDMLEFIWTAKLERDHWKGNSRQKEEALMWIYSMAAKNQEEDLGGPDFLGFYYAKRQAEQPRREMRKKLAMVGRGWVKAGFDFSKLDNSNFYVNEEAGEVHFFGFSATILNADINPWFIPELGIPGFEILDYNGKVDFRDAKELKLYCVGKLVAKAHEAGILKSAESNGVEILKNLFSLLTGKEIKKVFFHHDDIIQFSQAIADDQYISYHEATMLDRYLEEEWKTIDSLLGTRENSYKNNQLAKHRTENIRQILGLLYQLPFEDYPGHFNRLSLLAYEIARDSIVDRTEWDSLRLRRRPSFSKHLQTERLSLQDSFAYAAEYNMLLRYLLQRKLTSGIRIDSVTAATNASTSLYAGLDVLSYERVNRDSVKVYVLEDTVSIRKRVFEMVYPYHYDVQTWENMMMKEKLLLDSLPLAAMDSLASQDRSTLLYFRYPAPHLKRLDIPLDQWMEPLLLERHRKDTLLWLSPGLAIVGFPGNFKPLAHPDSIRLSAMQAQEIEIFLANLLGMHARQKKAGPAVRANQWVKKKFEDNTSLSEWFSEMKTKLSR